MRIVAHGARLLAASPTGLAYEATTSAADGLLEEFFAGYDPSFVLANEKESFAGFAECLAFNEGARYATLRGRYGPFREFIVVARNADAAFVGGLNFIAFALPDPGDAEVPISLNLNYIFVAPRWRRRGAFKSMIGELPGLALALFSHTNSGDIVQRLRAEPPRILLFLEQNDPYRLTPQDYARDTRATGLDQLARIALWARQGAKIVDFPYVQPALSVDQQADPNLVLAAFGAATPTLSPALLRQHLERFFGISVLKGRDPEGDAAARRQLALLAALAMAGERVALLAVGDPAALPLPFSAASKAGLRALLAPHRHAFADGSK
jgi:hypothetical protein